jgi:hypothetical protein
LLAVHVNELKSVYSNFMTEHNSVWRLKEIILNNVERYVRF